MAGWLPRQCHRFFGERQNYVIFISDSSFQIAPRIASVELVYFIFRTARRVRLLYLPIAAHKRSEAEYWFELWFSCPEPPFKHLHTGQHPEYISAARISRRKSWGWGESARSKAIANCSLPARRKEIPSIIAFEFHAAPTRSWPLNLHSGNRWLQSCAFMWLGSTAQRFSPVFRTGCFIPHLYCR